VEFLIASLFLVCVAEEKKTDEQVSRLILFILNFLFSEEKKKKFWHEMSLTRVNRSLPTISEENEVTVENGEESMTSIRKSSDVKPSIEMTAEL